MDPARFVFIDETGTATNMARRYGRSPSDRRLVAAVPHGHWRTTTFIAALSQAGIIAPLVLDGPMTGITFRAYVEQFLTPALRPGDVVVLDNLAALRCDRITAPCVIDGPINGTSFRAYVEQFLLPTLRTGDIVIMDNLGSHKRQAVRQRIRAAGAKLFFLPPYSPDLNPIEQLFAKLKALLRKAATRTKGELWSTIGRLLDACTATECSAYLRHCGYGSI